MQPRHRLTSTSYEATTNVAPQHLTYVINESATCFVVLFIHAYAIPGMWSRSRRLGLETVSRRTNVSSRSRLGQNPQHLGLGPMRLGLDAIRLVSGLGHFVSSRRFVQARAATIPHQKNSSPLCVKMLYFTSPNFFQEASCFHLSMEWMPLFTGFSCLQIAINLVAHVCKIASAMAIIGSL